MALGHGREGGLLFILYLSVLSNLAHALLNCSKFYDKVYTAATYALSHYPRLHPSRNSEPHPLGREKRCTGHLVALTLMDKRNISNRILGLNAGSLKESSAND